MCYSYLFYTKTNNGDFMKIRLGYACISDTLNITSSHSYTYSSYLNDLDHDLKLNLIINKNLDSLINLINYNIKNDIHFFRISSNIIPLSTKINFDYITPFLDKYKLIGKLINDNNMRVDFHLDQYSVLNSTKCDVVNSTISSLEYHFKLLDILNIKNKVLILHVGSNVFGKEASINRFINNFNKLDYKIRKSIVIENDDKIFNIDDCMKISKKTNIPIVLDYHHFVCNPSSISFKDIFSTWNITPKVHFSSPKSKLKKEFRSHNDYINVDDFIAFIDMIKELDTDIDIMIEAKKKDEALFRLIRELKFKTDYKFIDSTSFLV